VVKYLEKTILDPKARKSLSLGICDHYKILLVYETRQSLGCSMDQHSEVVLSSAWKPLLVLDALV